MEMSKSNININETMSIYEIANQWKMHYAKRLSDCTLDTSSNESEINEKLFICSPLLREGNCPRIYSHGNKTEHVLIITHGLSDSPWYVHFIAERFYKEGFNVIMPLLPGHGLIDPNEAMKDPLMSEKWKVEMDAAVEIAKYLGTKVSIGGFSTGGAMSYNKILRDPELIDGGLFLFSGALNIGSTVQSLCRIGFLGNIIKWKDGVIYSDGPDPYKYGTFPSYGGFQLAKVNNENQELEKVVKIKNPVFAGHSIHDETAKIDGVLNLLKNHEHEGSAFIIGLKVEHPEVPLKTDVPIDTSKISGKDYKPPTANPQFDMMMDDCMAFYRKYVS